MDGFYTTNGNVAMGYYESSDLPYYYSLLPSVTLCANYFCGVLSDTYPNRLVLYSGTTGGNTSNKITAGTLDYPCILDLLQSNNVSFKNYNFYCVDNYSVLALFKNWAQGGASNQLNQSMAQFFSDCTDNTLPQVAFITESTPYDEHPPANIHTGQSMIQSIVQAVQGTPAWASTALLLTYDEGGGFFDHISPPRLDAYGPGIRVPDAGGLPLRQKGLRRHHGLRPQLGIEVHRVCVRPADARFGQSRVRHQHADDEQRWRRGAVPAARWECRSQRLDAMLQLRLSGRRPVSLSRPE